MRKIMVTGAGGSASTNFIRSLRLVPEKFYIVGVDSCKYHLSLSKADVNYLIPDCHSKFYIEKLNDIILREEIELLHCQPDPEVLVVAQNRERIFTKTLLPNTRTIEIAQDKMYFNLLMSSKGVPVPKAWHDSNEGIKNIFNGKKLWVRAMQGAGSLAALPVTTYEQYLMWIQYWATRGIDKGNFMISEYLPGNEYAFQSLWYNGKIITSAARQRIEYLFQNRMPSGQSSTPTIAKSVHNPIVNTIATDAIKALDPLATGVFCVDLKEDEKGIPNVTEINVGRFFTTSLFFSVAGSNMPYTFCKLALNSGPELGETLLKYNAVPEDLYWIRQIDMGEAIIKEGEWKHLL